MTTFPWAIFLTALLLILGPPIARATIVSGVCLSTAALTSTGAPRDFSRLRGELQREHAELVQVMAQLRRDDMARHPSAITVDVYLAHPELFSRVAELMIAARQAFHDPSIDPSLMNSFDGIRSYWWTDITYPAARRRLSENPTTAPIFRRIIDAGLLQE